MKLLIAFLIPALLPALSAAQQPEAPAQRPPAQSNAAKPRLLYYDGVAVQAGDKVITLSTVNRFEALSLKERPVTTQAERMQLHGEALRQLAVQALESQAGEDLGLDPEAIRFQLQFQAEEERAKIGAAAYAGQLTEEGTNALEKFANQEAEYLRILWQRSRLGFLVADRRPSEDRYMRPGELRFSFRVNRDLLAPPQVRFRILIISAADVGGPELARASCEELRGQVLEGVEMGRLVEEFGAALRETQGLTPLMPVTSVSNSILRQLAGEEEGSLSAVTPLVGPRGEPDAEAGYQFALLYQKVVPPTPQFEDAGVQNRLRITHSNRRDSQILEHAKGRMVQQAYSWVHPGLAGAAGSRQQGAQPTPAAPAAPPTNPR